jgi:hypothetical protein
MKFDKRRPPPQLVRDCIHAFEVLRRLDFTADEIFCGVASVVGEGVAAVMVLRHPGSPEWTWVIGRLDREPEEFYTLWREAAAAWNASGGGVDLWGFKGSRIMRMSSMVVASLAQKGVALPCLQQHAN